MNVLILTKNRFCADVYRDINRCCDNSVPIFYYCKCYDKIYLTLKNVMLVSTEILIDIAISLYQYSITSNIVMRNIELLNISNLTKKKDCGNIYWNLGRYYYDFI